MHKSTNPHRLSALLAIVTIVASITFSGCYYDGQGYPAPYRGHGYDHDRHDHHRGYGNYRKLKPKEKAHRGYGRHAGHPHGGPPGLMKKRGRW